MALVATWFVQDQQHDATYFVSIGRLVIIKIHIYSHKEGQFRLRAPLLFYKMWTPVKFQPLLSVEKREVSRNPSFSSHTTYGSSEDDPLNLPVFSSETLFF